MNLTTDALVAFTSPSRGTELRIKPFRSGDRPRWDAFVATARNATMLHSRRFLDYHGDRFDDASLLIERAEGEIVGLFPAAIDPKRDLHIVSHPGATYGGLVRGSYLRGERVTHALALIADHYRSIGKVSLQYIAIPHIFHVSPCDDDLLALHRLEAAIERTDIASVIDLTTKRELSKGRKHAHRRAVSRGVEERVGFEYLPALWDVLSDNLANRYCARPTHTLPEITDLCERLPDRIKCRVGMLDREVLGGIITFDCGPALVTQYIGSSAAGRVHSVVDLLVQGCLRDAEAAGKRYLSFGTSMGAGGFISEGLFHFKSLFGAGAVAHCTYRLLL